MKILLFTKKAVYENTFIGDFPEPEPKKCNCFGSDFGSGRLRLRNTGSDRHYYLMFCFISLETGVQKPQKTGFPAGCNIRRQVWVIFADISFIFAENFIILPELYDKMESSCSL